MKHRREFPKRWRRLLAPLALSLALGSCTRSTSFEAPTLQAPTKDDVALVDGKSVSISAFLAIRDSLKLRSSELAFWICVSSLATQNRLKDAKRDVPLDRIVLTAKYALGEATWAAAGQAVSEILSPDRANPQAPVDAAQVRETLDGYLSHSLVQRNPRILAELH